MKTVVYETQEPLRQTERFIAWLTEEYHIKVKRKLTGETKTVFLPVYFFGETAQGARDRALAFWDVETAKKQAHKERGKTLARSKKVKP